LGEAMTNIKIKRKKLNHKGITLIELLAVIIILSIISTIAVVTIGQLFDRTRERADQATILSLNQATYYYKLSEGQLFPNANTDEERIDILYQLGFISKKPIEQHKNSRFFWDETIQFWCNISCIDNALLYDFLNNDVNIDENLKTNQNRWSVNDGYIMGDDGIIFFDNPRVVYTIELTAQIASGPISGRYGGFGILFETYIVSGTSDTGYILQFDRHFGQIIVRQRINSREQEPNLRYDVLIQNDTLIGFSQRFDTDSNRTVRDSQWWLETHTLKLTVSKLNNDKYLSVWVNNVVVFQNWLIPQPIEPENATLNKTGIRAWSNVEVKFYQLKINE